MDEKQLKKRNGIKNAAIIFLTIMLILTFFSNTIMNYSLPEVAIQYTQSGTITTEVRGTGEIVSGEPYNVIVDVARKIQSVRVKVGDIVEKGDILYVLEDKESEELQAARDQLDSLELEYKKVVLSGTIDKNVIASVEAGKDITVSAQQTLVDEAKAESARIQGVIDEVEAQIQALTIQMQLTQSAGVDLSTEKAALEKAEATLTQTKTEVAVKEVEIAALQAQEVPDQTAIETAQAQLLTLQTKQVTNEAAVATAQEAYDKKLNAGVSDTLTNLENQKSLAELNLGILQNELTESQTVESSIIQQAQDHITLKAQYDEIRAQRSLISELQVEGIGTQILAPVSGTIGSLTYEAGQDIAPGEQVATIQLAGDTFTVSYAVTTAQANTVKVGTEATIVNNWFYNDLKARLVSIRPDTEDPVNKKLLTFEIEGNDITAGQSITLGVGQQSGNYDIVVPNSAIKEDNNGNFVLVVESKSSPVGTRYIAKRVAIQVLAADDNKSAITGELSGWGDAVITTTNMPVEAGQLIRLAEE